MNGLPPGARIETGPLSIYLNEIDRTVRECAECWPDEYLDTSDGKRFRLVEEGARILSRHRELNSTEREWLNRQAGAIVEIGDEEKPMYYSTYEGLDAAWESLQVSYGVEADYWPK